MPNLGQNFVLIDTPRKDSSLQRITREYGDILVCQYPLGQDNEKSSMGGMLIEWNCPIQSLKLFELIFTTIYLLILPSSVSVREPFTCYQAISSTGTCVNETGYTFSASDCCNDLEGGAYMQNNSSCVLCPQSKL